MSGLVPMQLHEAHDEVPNEQRLRHAGEPIISFELMKNLWVATYHEVKFRKRNFCLSGLLFHSCDVITSAMMVPGRVKHTFDSLAPYERTGQHLS